jgi:hypothetical protein
MMMLCVTIIPIQFVAIVREYLHRLDESGVTLHPKETSSNPGAPQ